MSLGEKTERVEKTCKHFARRARQRYRDEGICDEISNTIPLLTHESVYPFGSSIECTELPHSDVDTLYCNEVVTVVSNLADVPCNTLFAALIIDCKAAPGYVKLQVIFGGQPMTAKMQADWILFKPECFDSDSNGRMVFYQFGRRTGCTIKDVPRHGPAIQLNKLVGSSCAKDHDLIWAFRYKSWPKTATEWISRKRDHGWPSKDIIKRFQNLGCFIVKVGSPGSRESKLEWRITFSLQERELMFGLNDVQHDCYLILKRIKKEFLNDDQNKAISSYHCKTCMFYTMERNPMSIWVPENLMYCVTICLKFLQECLLQRNCPNYFVDGENMLAKIQDERVLQKNAAKLKKIIAEKDFERYHFKHLFKNPYEQCIYYLESIYVRHIAEFPRVLSTIVDLLTIILEPIKMLPDLVNDKIKLFSKIIETFYE